MSRPAHRGAAEPRGNENPLEDATWLYSYADLMTQLLLFAILMLTVAGISAAPMVVSSTAPADDLGQAARDLDRYVADSDLGGSVAIERGADRVVIRVKSKLLFDEGQAALTPRAEEILGGLAGVVTRTGSAIRVEGHTDDRPIKSARFPSNWELSSARAISVATSLEARGVARGRLSVAGWGEHHPIMPNDDEEHRALNRRVEIVLIGGQP